MEVTSTQISLDADGVSLPGWLALPAAARALIVFAHGSGGSHQSSRNQHVASALQQAGFATLLFDLLTAEESDEDAAGTRTRFDVELLARRLRAVSAKLRRDSHARQLPIGYFGASTGAAAALIAAAEEPGEVGAIVARGGRPDLAGHWLPRVTAPTLLIVGGKDDLVLSLNKEALKQLRVGALEVVPGATHLFEQPGALDEVAHLAAHWFSRYLLHVHHRWFGPVFEARRFHNRVGAGSMLAGKLGEYAHQPDVIVLALPRGGVPVAERVAVSLGAPLDIINVRKLGFPGHEELAIGALATGGVRVLNPTTLRYVSEREVEAVTARESRELERREWLYRSGRPAPDLRGRTVILVDDGAATGATMRAAIAAVRTQLPARIVVAIPTAPPDTCVSLAAEADELICLIAPELFFGVGQWYEDFSGCSDEMVREVMQRTPKPRLLQPTG